MPKVKYGMELLCFANPKSRTQIDRSRANSLVFFSFAFNEFDLRGLSLKRETSLNPAISWFLLFSAYLLTFSVRI